MSKHDDQEITLVVDKATKMPLCVLLQAMFGGESSSFLPTELWQLTPPAEPARVTGTLAQWNEWAKTQMEIRRLICMEDLPSEGQNHIQTNR